MVMFLKIAVSICSLISLTVAVPSANNTAPNSISSQYIVQLKPASDITQHLSWVQKVHAHSLRKRQLFGREPLAGILHDFPIADNSTAYIGQFDEDTVAQIKTQDSVLAIEQDQWVKVPEFRHVTLSPSPASQPALSHGAKIHRRAPQGCQHDAPWNLKHISQYPPAGKYISYCWLKTVPVQYAYILDTGIRIDHPDFQGRAIAGYTAVASKSDVDTSGHGTHVAGIVGSATWGVMKESILVSVKVYDEQGGAMSDIIKGYWWTLNKIRANGQTGKSVILLPIDCSESQLLLDAIQVAYAMGITTVVPAGNTNKNVNEVFPANLVEVLTVSSMNETYHRVADANFGDGINIFAPGENIRSTWINEGGHGDGTGTLTGTSMAAAHVAGMLLYWQGLIGVQSPERILRFTKLYSYKDYLTNLPEGTPNFFVHNNWPESQVYDMCSKKRRWYRC